MNMSNGAPMLSAAALFAATALLSACGSDRGANRTVNPGTGGGAGATASSGGSGGANPGSGGTGGTSAGGSGGVELPGVGPASLPLVVDAFYAPSGYMGDGEATGNVVMTPVSDTDTTCNGDRAKVDAVGNCHHVTYTVAGLGWAGVYWQYPANNWGTHPGLTVPPGATRVVFSAKGAQGVEIVDFSAGLQTTDTPYGDSFTVKSTVNLTAAWQEYSLDLTGQSYDVVIAPFEWAAGEALNPNPIEFYVDDIHWE
jgi:hypothetical protein